MTRAGDIAPQLEALLALRATVLADIELEDDPRRRAEYASDASNYRVVPGAVAFPRSADEVAVLVRECARLKVPVTPRGGGTSMAGNALGPGLVLDLSRHLNRIRSIDAESGTTVVEAGLVLDDLRDACRPLGLTFGPDPSSHSRCTIGGMIGNDACGNHSVRDGRTGEHILELELVLADGTRALADEHGVKPHDLADSEKLSRIEIALKSLVSDSLEMIRTELGRIPRQVSGYQLQHLLPENHFNVARAIAGTEGTWAIVVGAKLRLIPLPTAPVLVALGYPDVVAAARDIPTILKHLPSAVEGMDEAIVATMRARRGDESVAGLPRGSAWLFVELDAVHLESATTLGHRLIADLRHRENLLEGRVIDEPSEQASLWRVREDGAGLAARLLDGPESWPGWEDAAVSPESLADYIRDFKKLLADHRFSGVLYGHFGAGCVHVRIDFDMSSSQGVAAMQAFLRDAALLVSSYGGTLSGEHGDGRARSDLLNVMYSETAIGAFVAAKLAWDPQGVLNPHMVVDPSPVSSGLLLPLMTTAGPTRTTTSFGSTADGFDGEMRRCVGIGKCRSSSGGTMCPSYRATLDEKDSTRGRARVLQSMLVGDVVADGWKSKEVIDALDLCLSCKACSVDCPAGVDMASYKSEALHQHYRRSLRPRAHYALGWLPLWLALAGQMPSLANRLMQTPVVAKLAKRAAGVSPLRPLPLLASKARRGDVPRTTSPTKVWLLEDSFTRAFRPETSRSMIRVLDSAGLGATKTPTVCCGLTWITTGQLSTAKRVLRRTIRILDSVGSEAEPIVIAEPSCAAALKKDAPALLRSAASHRVADRIETLGSVLSSHAEPGWLHIESDRPIVLQTHCHEYAEFGPGRQAKLLEELGFSNVEQIDGCCGLAGNFGFETEHYDTSLAVAELNTLPAVRAASPATTIVADGFSCQTQIEQLTGRTTSHLAELIEDSWSAGQPREGNATAP